MLRLTSSFGLLPTVTDEKEAGYTCQAEEYKEPDDREDDDES